MTIVKFAFEMPSRQNTPKSHFHCVSEITAFVCTKNDISLVSLSRDGEFNVVPNTNTCGSGWLCKDTFTAQHQYKFTSKVKSH